MATSRKTAHELAVWNEFQFRETIPGKEFQNNSQEDSPRKKIVPSHKTSTGMVQHAKQRAIPALYFTNLISARPLMGPAGAGSLAQVVNTAMANKGRMNRMSEFFAGVGSEHGAGIWEDTPQDRPLFKKKYAALNEAARKAAEAVGS